ncbi:MAG: hypothetical protein EOP48_28465 [Sphingobacteriales bacterium]|nr:MAG: hypothetical protein EOP48_28465 [Sphingobacteriales bacterium]
MNITLDIKKRTSHTRDKVYVSVKAADQNGKPVQSVLSVTVFDRYYQRPGVTGNILTYYYLSTQLKGRIYDPGYYFDENNQDRAKALDNLLLTQGWRCYLWNVDELDKIKNRKRILTDSTSGVLIARSKKKDRTIQALMAFSTDESEKRMILTDSLGRFALAPEDFVKGRWNYLKSFYAGNTEFTLSMEDQFKNIRELAKKINIEEAEEMPVLTKRITQEQDRTDPKVIRLNEVKIIAKKQNVFRDKYIGHLDSLLKWKGIQILFIRIVTG